MKKTEKNLMLISAFFIMSLLVSNVTAGKVVGIYSLTVPSAVVAYGITFLCTDVVNEIWGREKANDLVKAGFIVQLFSLGLIILAMKLPPASFALDYANSFNIVLGQSARMVIASLTAYLISQTHDVIVFNKLKAKTGGRMKWLRNNLSTATSQLIDTSIFITIAFYGVVPNLPLMIVSQYLVKFCIAILDTPFFYLLTRNTTAKEEA